MKRKFKIKLSVWQFLALGYLAVIAVGSVLLVLPIASADGTSTSYLDALFVATASACVTGLSTVDTGTHWSLFGQIVLLVLIQTGGLGFMTFVSTVFLMFKHRMRQYERKALLSDAGAINFYGISKLVKRIFIGTAIFELLGMCLLCIRFIPEYGGIGAYYALWHAVSAFCNAGMDLVGVGGTSLSAYATDPLVSLTFCFLITMGGLGFIVWSDFIDCRGNFKKMKLNTKIILLWSLIINVVATVLFFAFEYNGQAFSGYNFGEKLLCSFFMAVSSRTAGFYTTAPSALCDSSYLLTIIIMFIGGSTGSTAGGIKVGTFAVIIMGMLAVFRGYKDINIGKKRIEYSLLSQALAIFTACLMLILMGTLAICALETDPAVTFNRVLFECVSALGTGGLSLDLTPQLNIGAKCIIIVLMYAGRVGILTLALALGEKRSISAVRKPIDTLLIG
ncbi:MAG: Trk family potassium uptake protein [Clostridia bacterium]|nr:Trk family potassium uptake protein [Clostridia bacterium]